MFLLDDQYFRMNRIFRIEATALLLASLLALIGGACNPAPTRTPGPAPAQSPAAACTPRLFPMPTGEKESRVIVKTAPPARVAPRETIVIELSGGYGLIGNYARMCGEEVIGYVFADELPDFQARRTVQVTLDDRPLAEAQCKQDCRIEVAIPRDTSPGTHRLQVHFPSYTSDTTFEIEVADEGTPEP
jgi:hypothetical protein